MSPTFWVDVTTTARRGRLFWIRFVYAGFLLLVMLTCAQWTSFRSHDLTDLRRSSAWFAASFFSIFAWTQILAIWAVAPALFAGMIAGDRERGVLDDTFVTQLSNREIIVGKLAGRLLDAAHLLAVSVPILCLASLLGGIRGDSLVMMFVVAGSAVLSVAGLSLWFSTTCQNSRVALRRTYTSLLVVLLIAPSLILGVLRLAPELYDMLHDSLIGIVDVSEVFRVLHPGMLMGEVVQSIYRGDPPPWSEIGVHAAVNVGFLTLCVAASMKQLRLVQFAPKAAATARGGRGRIDLHKQLFAGQPLLWKDVALSLGGGGRGWLPIVIEVLVVGGLIAASVSAIIATSGGRSYGVDEFVMYAAYMNTGVACVALLMIIVNAAGSITVESEKDTLLVLAATPLDEREILWNKLLASLYSARGAAVVILVNDVFSLGRDPKSFPSAVLAGFIFIALAFAFAATGVRLSVGAKSTTTANVLAVVVWFFCLGGYFFTGVPCCMAMGGAEGGALALAPCVPFLISAPYYLFEAPSMVGTTVFFGVAGYAFAGTVSFPNAIEMLRARFRPQR